MAERVDNKHVTYFNQHIRLLNSLGVWTDWRIIGGSLLLTIIYSILAILLFIIAPQFCHVVYMYKARDNVVAFADEFHVSLPSLMVVIKDYTLIRNRNVIQEMFDIMDSEIMQPAKEQRKIIKSVMNFWKKTFNAIVFLQCFFCVCQLATPIIDKIQNGTKNVPLVDCYPFNIYRSPVYEVMYIYQCFLLFYLVFHSLLFDMLVTGLLSLCAGECEVLFENINALKLEETEPIYKRNLRECIKHHEELHMFTTKIEKCFSFVILLEYFSSLISCCTTMFKLSLAEPKTMDFYKVLCYQLIIFLRMFQYCWSASNLTEKSERLPSAAYEAFRVDTSKSTKSTLKLFIGKTQKPLKVRTLLFDLSMQQYLQLLKNSFSYYTVLNTLNEK